MRFAGFRLVRDRAQRALLEDVETLRLRLHRLGGELARARARLRELGDPEAPPAAEGPDHGAGELSVVPRLAGEAREYVEPPTPPPSPLAMFHVLEGWTSQFVIEGERVGGTQALTDDPRLRRLLAAHGGVEGRRVLELGPLEGAHTLMLHEAGAASIEAVEGFRPAWLRCLVIKEIFGLDRARFRYGDLRDHLRRSADDAYDLAVALGVLYHLEDPAATLHALARVAPRLALWTHVAGEGFPEGGEPTTLRVGDREYPGVRVSYGDLRNRARNYSGGVDPGAVWLRPDALRRCLEDAGYTRIQEEEGPESPRGPSRLIAASRGEAAVEPFELAATSEAAGHSA